MEAELANQVITGLPNFVFGAIAIYVLYRANNRLMDTNERLCRPACDDCEEKQKQA